MESDAVHGIRQLDLAALKAKFTEVCGPDAKLTAVKCELCRRRMPDGVRYVMLLNVLGKRDDTRLDVARAHVECAMKSGYAPRVDDGCVSVWTRKRSSEDAEVQTAGVE